MIDQQRTSTRLRAKRADFILACRKNHVAAYPYAALVIALAAFRVLVRLPSHFWLDETMSYWTAGTSFHDILVRCRLWPHPVAYSTLVLALRFMGATSEWIYRLPSFLAMGFSTFLLFRICRSLFGSHSAWMCIAVFVMLNPVQFAAGDARPYALGLLFVMISTGCFLKFLETPGYWWAVFYGLSTAAIFYFQILFGAVLPVHGFYLLHQSMTGRRFRALHVLTALATAAVIASPVVMQFLRFTGNAESHSFAANPAFDELVQSYLPVFLVFLFELLAILALILPGVKWERNVRGKAVLLPILWALFPPALLFLISISSPAKVFVPRYFLSSAPGLAICIGTILASFRPKIVRPIIFGILALFALREIGRPTSFRHTVGLGDWGAAAAYVTGNVAADNAPVLVRSQFIESDFMPVSPIEDNGTFAQLSFYPIRARLIPLSNTFTSTQAQLIRVTLNTLSRKTRRFLFVSYSGPAPVQPFLYYIQGAMGPRCKVTQLADFDGVVVTEFMFPPTIAAGAG